MILKTIWQLCTLNITSFRSKARPAKLWEPSSQGTEISPQNCQIEVQRPRLATKDTHKLNPDTSKVRYSGLHVRLSIEHLCFLKAL